MAGYRLYKLDGVGNIAEAKWLDASDDDDAVRQARDHDPQFACEIWAGDRLVARVEARPAANDEGSASFR